jgi:hypothetical protein
MNMPERRRRGLALDQPGCGVAATRRRHEALRWINE